jgi:hypothetical protein
MKLKVILAFVGAGLLTLALSVNSFAGTECNDNDTDGICDTVDNCVDDVNPAQRDDDLDGYGNICDTDLNQDCVAGGADIGLVGQYWLAAPPWVANPAGNGTTGAFDINEDNVVGGGDIGQVGQNWLGAIGPSGLPCAAWCVGTTPVLPPPAACP